MRTSARRVPRGRWRSGNRLVSSCSSPRNHLLCRWPGASARAMSPGRALVIISLATLTSSVGVARNHLAAGAGAQGPPDGLVDAVLDGADRTVGQEQVDD